MNPSSPSPSAGPLDAALNRSALQDGHGLPQERLARMAARRAFVTMKLRYLEAAAKLSGPDGAVIASQIRRANDPIELWDLRPALFAALYGTADTMSSMLADLPQGGTAQTQPFGGTRPVF
jgi:hypothetical protein